VNKKVIAIVAVVLVLGVGGYLLWKSQGAKAPSGVQTGTETPSGLKSLKELIAAGVAQKCTFSTSNESGSSEGTTFVAGGKMRGDFTSVVAGKTTKSHMIVDGNTNYIWTDGEKTGFKTTFEETESSGGEGTSGSPETTAEGQTDLNQKVDYKCSAWVTDLSQFAPPSDVQFTDLSQMFKPSALPDSNPQ